ncbi:VOC family protein [Curtobacterium sp. 22159]|uniref:VOC family protein n=1 Tax=Curtobacterium sp. 22159 TaxID=3453882 RepID=UPI003F851DC3
MDEALPNIVAVLARVPVDSIDASLPLYRQLAGTEEVRAFEFGTVRLAWVGVFLLLEGADAATRSRAATIIVRDVELIASTVQTGGGELLEGPMSGPNGRRLIARHADGNVLEYIEQR